MSTTYTPRADSLPSRVITFFSNNPEEVLDLDALEAKFDKPRSQWHTILGQAVSAGLLKRAVREDDEELVYSLGGGLPNTIKAIPPPKADALTAGGWLGKKTATRASPFKVDFDNITFVSNVPIPQVKGRLNSGFEAVFLKMKAGQMFEVPFEARASLALVATKLKRAGSGVWEMRKLGELIGVWRVK